MGMTALKLLRKSSKPHLMQQISEQVIDGAKGIARVRRNLKLALMGVLALILSKFLVELPPLQPIKDEAQGIATIIFLLFGIVLSVLLFFDLIFSIWSRLQRKIVPVELCTALALAFAIIPIAIATFSADVEVDAFLSILFIVAFDRQMSLSFKREMERFASADLRFFKKGVKKIVFSAAENVSDKTQLELNLSGGSETVLEVDPRDLKVGDFFRLSKGDIVPCDAVIRSGFCKLLERKIGFWGRPGAYVAGVKIFAGSEVKYGEALCEVLQTAEDSEYQQFLDELHKVQDLDQKQVSTHGVTVVAVVLFITCMAVVYWQGRGEDISTIANIAAAVLFAATLGRAITMYPLYRSAVFGSNFIRGIFLKTFSVFERLKKVNKVVMDYDVSDPVGLPQVVDFQLIDTRIDEEVLAAILFSFFGRAEGDLNGAIASYMYKKYPLETFYTVSDFHDYNDRGFSAKVEGSEFSVGNEVFLVERGVHMQTSDVTGAKYSSSEMVYIALEKELVAKIEIAPPLFEDGRKLHDDLVKQKVEVELYGKEVEASLVERTGMMVAPHGLPGEASAERELSYLRSITDLTPWRKRNSIIGSVLNELNWDLSVTDIAFFSRDLSLITFVIRAAKRWQKIIFFNYSCAAVFGVTLLTLAVLGLVSPIVVAGMALVGNFLIFFNTTRI